MAAIIAAAAANHVDNRRNSRPSQRRRSNNNYVSRTSSILSNADDTAITYANMQVSHVVLTHEVVRSYTDVQEYRTHSQAKTDACALYEHVYPIFVGEVEERIVEPRSQQYATWLVLILVLLVFSAVVTPWEVCVMQTDSGPPLFWFNRLVDLVFFTDMLLQMHVAVWTESSAVLEVRGHEILVRYIQTWFVFDLIAAVPWALCHNGNEVLKLLPMLRLCKIFNSSRYHYWYLRWMDHLSVETSKVYDVLSLLLQYCMNSLSAGTSKVNLAMNWVLIICVAHWIACIWCLMMALENEDQPHWISTTPGSWSSKNVSLSDAYPAALNLATLTQTGIGYGDVVPANEDERWLSIPLQLLGACLYTYVIACSMMIVGSMHREQFRFNSLVDALDDLSEDVRLPEDLTIRSREHLQREQAVEKAETQLDLLRQMCLPMQAACNADLIRLLHTCRYFRSLRSGCLSMLLLRLRPEVYPAGELILMAGRVDSMVFVTSGVVSQYGQLSPSGSVFGVEAIAEMGNLKKPVHAFTNVKVYRLSRKAIREVVSHFSHSTRELRREVVKLAFRRGIGAAVKRVTGDKQPQTRSPVILAKLAARQKRSDEGKITKEKSSFSSSRNAFCQISPPQVADWEESLVMSDLEMVIEKQREVLKLDKEIAEAMVSISKLHNKVSASCQTVLTTKRVDGRLARATRQIYKTANQGEISVGENLEQFWVSRESLELGLDFVTEYQPPVGSPPIDHDEPV